MHEKTLLKERLEQIMEAVLRIERRFVGIETPLDFMSTDANHDKLDAIAMLLIAIGGRRGRSSLISLFMSPHS